MLQNCEDEVLIRLCMLPHLAVISKGKHYQSILLYEGMQICVEFDVFTSQNTQDVPIMHRLQNNFLLVSVHFKLVNVHYR